MQKASVHTIVTCAALLLLESRGIAEINSIPDSIPNSNLTPLEHFRSSFTQSPLVPSAPSPILTGRLQPPDPRQQATLLQALLGHWTTNHGQTQYFFSPQQVTIVNQASSVVHPSAVVPDAIVQVMSYEIVAIDEASGTVKLKIDTPLDWLELRMLQFTPNRQSLMESIDFLGHQIESEWSYVSNVQQPLLGQLSW